MSQALGRRINGVLAVAIAMAFALTALFAFAPRAHAVTPTPELGNPDFTQPRSLTIHKYAQPETKGKVGTGEELKPAPTATPLKGVEFTIKKINEIDLTDPTQWDQVKTLQYDGSAVTNSADTGKSYTLAAETKKVTNASGEASFADLEAGVYLVEEGADTGDNHITAKAAPFFVTVPLPKKDTTEGKDGWIYDVHVYPKNSVTEATKKVDDSKAHKLGDDVDWTVDVKVPHLAEGKKHTNMVISDKFDPRLSYKSVVVKHNGETLAEGTDYNVTASKEGKQDKAVVKFTDAGLKKLQDGKVVSAIFTTTVNEVGDGVIKNKAIVFVDKPESDNEEDGVPTNEPETKWGLLIIHKFDKDNKRVLEGAEFTVYLTKDDADNNANPVIMKATDDEGNVEFGLKKGTYYVKETKAPAGYVLDQQVHTVEIHADSATSVEVELEVPNTKQTVPDLPVTGASGQMLMMIGGGALLLLAAGTGVVAMRRR